MIERSGDLWLIQGFDVRVITVNGELNKSGYAIMGAGTAVEAADYFLGLSVKLGEFISKYESRCFLMPEPYIFPDGSRLVTMPTKHKARERSDIELIKASAQQLMVMADKFGWERVVMPRPGCGKGGLNWTDVRPALDDILDDRFTVLEPPAYVLAASRRAS